MDKTIFITASGRRPPTPKKNELAKREGGSFPRVSISLLASAFADRRRVGGVGLWFATRLVAHAHAQASGSTLLILWTRYYSCRCPAADKTDLYVPMCGAFGLQSSRRRLPS